MISSGGESAKRNQHENGGKRNVGLGSRKGDLVGFICDSHPCCCLPQCEAHNHAVMLCAGEVLV